MTRDLSRLVTERLAQAMGVPPESFSPDTEIDDRIWEEEVIDQLLEELGVNPSALFPPRDPSPRSEIAVAGLRRLAPFSDSAARRLEAMARRWDVVTLGSLTRSLEDGRPVPSGRIVTVTDVPLPLGRSLARFAAWTSAVGGMLSLGLWADCNPACMACLPLTDVAAQRGLPVALALVGGVHLLILGAALRAVAGTGGLPARA